jgi:saccharopine dehydrogenase-like NADP-dependent oxidoreductase
MYVIAPLNAAAVKQYRDEIKDVFVGGLPDIGLVAKMALASLQRNYPGMTLEMVEQMIDYQNYFDVWEALLNLSGLVAQAKEMMRRVNEQMETTASTT